VVQLETRGMSIDPAWVKYQPCDLRRLHLRSWCGRRIRRNYVTCLWTGGIKAQPVVRGSSSILSS